MVDLEYSRLELASFLRTIQSWWYFQPSLMRVGGWSLLAHPPSYTLSTRSIYIIPVHPLTSKTSEIYLIYWFFPIASLPFSLEILVHVFIHIWMRGNGGCLSPESIEWVIEDQALLRSYNSVPLHLLPPPLLQSVSLNGNSQEVWETETTCWRESGRKGVG